MDFKRVDTRQTIAPLYKACRLVSLKYRLTVREEMQSASNHHCCGCPIKYCRESVQAFWSTLLSKCAALNDEALPKWDN